MINCFLQIAKFELHDIILFQDHIHNKFNFPLQLHNKYRSLRFKLCSQAHKILLRFDLLILKHYHHLLHKDYHLSLHPFLHFQHPNLFINPQ